jgi:hypothetical protein
MPTDDFLKCRFVAALGETSHELGIHVCGGRALSGALPQVVDHGREWV